MPGGTGRKEGERMRDRLTKRVGKKVYINDDVIHRSDCEGEFAFHFCKYTENCSSFTNRKCPVLRVLDKLADYEDKEEAEKVLKERESK